MNARLPNARPRERGEQRLQRAFEILPGALTWTTLVGLAVFSWAEPWGMAVFVILFDLYWLIRVVYFSGLMMLAYLRLRRELGIDWLARVKGVSNLPGYIKRLEQEHRQLESRVRNLYGPERRVALRRLDHLRRHREELGALQKQDAKVKPWQDVYHLVVIATYRENYAVLEATCAALTRAHYPRERIIVVLATEAREGDAAIAKAQRLEKKFGDRFCAFLTTCHPDGIAGEARVKGANITWAARRMREWLDHRGIAYDNVVISVFDADTCVEPGYFACLTYHYITRGDRTRCSYQPLPMYHNNIWDAPVFSRVAATITSYWQMVQSIRPDLLVTFSSHAMSFQALVDVDFWPVDVISDDSVIFYRCLLRYGGDYRTVPMFVAVHMDANVGKTHWHTFTSLYRQMRRWAWGVENLPLLVRGFLRDRVIPVRKKIRYTLQLLESHYTWSTAAIVLTIYTWLPLWAGGEAFGREVLAHNLPRVTEWMFRIAGIGMVVSAFLGIVTLPPRPARYPWHRWIWMTAQWLLAPLYYVVLVAVPAVDAQTRMMFGKYLSFVVTEKQRPVPSVPAPVKPEGIPHKV